MYFDYLLANILCLYLHQYKCVMGSEFYILKFKIENSWLPENKNKILS